jgi:hypothetical protein
MKALGQSRSRQEGNDFRIPHPHFWERLRALLILLAFSFFHVLGQNSRGRERRNSECQARLMIWSRKGARNA